MYGYIYNVTIYIPLQLQPQYWTILSRRDLKIFIWITYFPLHGECLITRKQATSWLSFSRLIVTFCKTIRSQNYMKMRLQTGKWIKNFISYLVTEKKVVTIKASPKLYQCSEELVFSTYHFASPLVSRDNCIHEMN